MLTSESLGVTGSCWHGSHWGSRRPLDHVGMRVITDQGNWRQRGSLGVMRVTRDHWGSLGALDHVDIGVIECRWVTRGQDTRVDIGVIGNHRGSLDHISIGVIRGQLGGLRNHVSHRPVLL